MQVSPWIFWIIVIVCVALLILLIVMYTNKTVCPEPKEKKCEECGICFQRTKFTTVPDEAWADFSTSAFDPADAVQFRDADVKDSTMIIPKFFLGRCVIAKGGEWKSCVILPYELNLGISKITDIKAWAAVYSSDDASRIIVMNDAESINFHQVKYLSLKKFGKSEYNFKGFNGEQGVLSVPDGAVNVGSASSPVVIGRVASSHDICEIYLSSNSIKLIKSNLAIALDPIDMNMAIEFLIL